jgi:hypothetical protein
MTEINLDKYQLNQEILNQPDYVLELWYGKTGLFFIKQLRKVTNLKYNIDGIFYYDDNNVWFIHYHIKHEEFAINNKILSNCKVTNRTLDILLIKKILEEITNLKIKHVW